MTDEQLWKEFCIENNIDEDTEYDAWAFCGGGPFADSLGVLVLEGKKFGTASIYAEYLEEGEELPKVGNYSVLLDQFDNAYAVVKETDVSVQPFGRVSDYHGYSEGEGERDLASWRSIHEEYWKPDFERMEIPFSYETLAVIEKFTVEYVAADQRLLPGVPADELVEECYLIEPNMRYADQIAAYRTAFLERGDSLDGTLSLKRMPDPVEWVEYCLEWGNPLRQPGENVVRGTELMCIRKRDDKLVGMIQVHTMPDDHPREAVGHIGYSVLPEERRKGYAKWMLKKGVEYLKYAYKIDRAIISVLPDNEGSKRTILANGGQYLDTVLEKVDNVTLDRYFIDYNGR